MDGPLKISQSWSQLRRRSPAALRKTTERGLVRQLREELYAGSPHLRRCLDGAGYQPFRFKAPADLAQLPTSGLMELLQVPPQQLVLRPAPRAMKELWPFGRKLALVLAGRRAGPLLEAAYDPVLATEEQGLAVTWTRSDLELCGELGARVLDLCGLGAGARLTSHLPDEPSFEGLLLSSGAERLGLSLAAGAPNLALPTADAARLLQEHEGDLELVLLFGAPPDEELRRTLAARGARCATCWTCGPARVAAVEAPAAAGTDPTGLMLFPDLVAAELLEPDGCRTADPGERGELVLTGLGQHGTALLRFRTGASAARIDWTPCPRSGLALPRVLDLIPLP